MTASTSDGGVRAGRLVKAADARVEPLYPAARLLKGNVLEVSQTLADAQRALEAAQGEAQRTRTEAAEEAAALREQVRRDAGRQVVDEFSGLLAATRQAVERFGQDVEARAERLVQQFARSILETELTVRPELMVKLVRSVLDRAKAYSQITVVLHPQDLARVREAGEQLLDALPFAEQIHFREDAGLALHGCRIETEMGTFDGSLELQLERLHEHVKQEGARTASSDAHT